MTSFRKTGHRADDALQQILARPVSTPVERAVRETVRWMLDFTPDRRPDAEGITGILKGGTRALEVLRREAPSLTALHVQILILKLVTLSPVHDEHASLGDMIEEDGPAIDAWLARVADAFSAALADPVQAAKDEAGRLQAEARARGEKLGRNAALDQVARAQGLASWHVLRPRLADAPVAAPPARTAADLVAGFWNSPRRDRLLRIVAPAGIRSRLGARFVAELAQAGHRVRGVNMLPQWSAATCVADLSFETRATFTDGLEDPILVITGMHPAIAREDLVSALQGLRAMIMTDDREMEWQAPQDAVIAPDEGGLVTIPETFRLGMPGPEGAVFLHAAAEKLKGCDPQQGRMLSITRAEAMALHGVEGVDVFAVVRDTDGAVEDEDTSFGLAEGSWVHPHYGTLVPDEGVSLFADVSAALRKGLWGFCPAAPEDALSP